MHSLKQWATYTAVAVVFFMLHCMMPSPGHAAEESTYVFMDEAIPPYTYGKDGSIVTKGLTKEIFDELFKRLGLHYEIRLVPWARAMDNVRYGHCDGIPLLMKTREREEFLEYSAPVVENRELIYYRPNRLGELQWDTLLDLSDHTFGLVRGYTYDSSLMEAIEKYNIPVTYSKDSTMNFTMLQAGRVDLIVEDETVAKPILKANPDWVHKIASASKKVSSYYWHIGISQKSPLADRVDEINRVLGEMHEDGTLEGILSKR